MGMLVQWEDKQGNLYEAGLITREYEIREAYIKKWDMNGRNSAIKGAHTILWRGISPPANPYKLIDTLIENAKQYGCSKEKILKLRS